VLRSSFLGNSFHPDDWVLCVDLASSRETTRCRLPSTANSLAFHPNNRRLAVGYANNDVASIYDSAQGRHVADLPVGSMNEQVVTWHPDGVRLALAVVVRGDFLPGPWLRTDVRADSEGSKQRRDVGCVVGPRCGRSSAACSAPGAFSRYAGALPAGRARNNLPP
jgi:hypothetical protein